MFLLLFKFTTKAQSIHGGIGDVSIDGKCSFFGRRRGLSHLFSQKDGEGPCDKMWNSAEGVKALCRSKSPPQEKKPSAGAGVQGAAPPEKRMTTFKYLQKYEKSLWHVWAEKGNKDEIGKIYEKFVRDYETFW